MNTKTQSARPKFCSECGNRLRDDARFCHECGATIDGQRRAGAAATSVSAAPEGTTSRTKWIVPGLAVAALLILSVWSASARSTPESAPSEVPLGAMRAGGAGGAPDISSMSPEERADRLFNRVMRLSSEGKSDSAAFFASMAIGAIESLGSLDAHRRYDMGLVALVAGDAGRARAQADTILAQRRTHLLGLSLAARAAEARGDTAAGRAFQRRLLAAEAAEKAAGLQEYTDHEADVRAAIESARRG